MNNFTDYELYKILDENNYLTSEENLNILKEGIETGDIELFNENEREEYSDYELYQILENNGYDPCEENLSILKENLSSGAEEIVDEYPDYYLNQLLENSGYKQTENNRYILREGLDNELYEICLNESFGLAVKKVSSAMANAGDRAKAGIKNAGTRVGGFFKKIGAGISGAARLAKKRIQSAGKVAVAKAYKGIGKIMGSKTAEKEANNRIADAKKAVEDTKAANKERQTSIKNDVNNKIAGRNNAIKNNAQAREDTIKKLTAKEKRYKTSVAKTNTEERAKIQRV